MKAKEATDRTNLGRMRHQLGQSGQVLLLYLIFALPMTMITLSVFNVGMMVSEKMKMQNAADNAAYSAAVWEARYMNLTAYTTRAMIANYDALATVIAFWSMTDSLDGFLFILKQVVQVIPIVNAATPAVQALHEAIGVVNKVMATAVGANSEGSGNPGFGRAMEVYNKILSFLQPALYALNQISRQDVIAGVAWGVDPKIQANTFGEVFNAVSMHSRLKWDVTDGTNGLRLATERSLNEFSDGKALRDGINFKIGPLTVGGFFGVDLFFCSIGVRIGPDGFAGPPFDHVEGDVPECPGSEDTAGKCTHEIVKTDQIRQNEFFGVKVSLCVANLSVGHYSDDDYNIGGSKTFGGGGGIDTGINLPHIADFENQANHSQLFDDKGLGCSFGGGAFGGLNLNSLTQFDQPNQQCQEFKQRNQDDDPDNDVALPDQFVDVNGTKAFCSDAAQSASILGGHGAGPTVGDLFEDAAEDLQEQAQASAGGAGGGGNTCATAYKFSEGESLDKVKVTTYVGDSQVEDGRRIEGPTVLAYFRKRAGVLPMFKGLGLTNPNDIEVYSFAKVFYAQRVGDRESTPCSKNNRTGCNKETLFNPFWGARLERPEPFGLKTLLH